MLVHSFSASHCWFEDFQAFAHAMGTPVSSTNELSAEVEVDGLGRAFAGSVGSDGIRGDPQAECPAISKVLSSGYPPS